MDFRRILMLVILAVILLGCSGEAAKAPQVSAAEAQATQQAIARRDEFDARVYEIKMALAWPRMIIWTFLVPAIIVTIIFLVKRLVDQWMSEREVIFNERRFEVEVQKDLLFRQQEKRKLPPKIEREVGEDLGQIRPIDMINRASPGEYDDIVRIAEKKLK